MHPGHIIPVIVSVTVTGFRFCGFCAAAPPAKPGRPITDSAMAPRSVRLVNMAIILDVLSASNNRAEEGSPTTSVHLPFDHLEH